MQLEEWRQCSEVTTPPARRAVPSCRPMHRPTGRRPVSWLPLSSKKRGNLGASVQLARAASPYPERREALQEARPQAGERGIRARTADVDGPGVFVMSISLERVAEKDRVAKKLSGGTRKEYRSTVTQWLAWGQGVDVDRIERQHIRDFLEWVHEKATQDAWANAVSRTRPGTTSEPSCPGPGSRTTGRSCPGSPSPSRSATSPDDTTSRRRT